jgi:hypothetical protein
LCSNHRWKPGEAVNRVFFNVVGLIVFSTLAGTILGAVLEVWCESGVEQDAAQPGARFVMRLSAPGADD